MLLRLLLGLTMVAPALPIVSQCSACEAVGGSERAHYLGNTMHPAKSPIMPGSPTTPASCRWPPRSGRGWSPVHSPPQRHHSPPPTQSAPIPTYACIVNLRLYGMMLLQKASSGRWMSTSRWVLCANALAPHCLPLAYSVHAGADWAGRGAQGQACVHPAARRYTPQGHVGYRDRAKYIADGRAAIRYPLQAQRASGLRATGGEGWRDVVLLR